jgi:hypothetical protein
MLEMHDMKTIKTGKLSYTKTRRNAITGTVVDVEKDKDCVAVLQECTKCGFERAYLTDGFVKHTVDVDYIKTLEPFNSFCNGEQGSVPNTKKNNTGN